MSDTAESLLREHLKLCAEVRHFVPTFEEYWAGGDGEYCRARRWYFESDLKKRTEALLSALPSQDQSVSQTVDRGIE